MKGVFVSFKEFDSPTRDHRLFISASNWDEFNEKFKAYFSTEAENEGEYVSYFNFMSIDSDFASNHNYDAEVSVHCVNKDTSFEFSRSYKIDYEVVSKTL